VGTPTTRWEFRALDAVRLPVFRRDVLPPGEAGYAAFYAPGFLTVVEAAEANHLEAAVRTRTHAPPVLERAAADLLAHARQALRRWEAMTTAPFSPVCLTLYIGDRCNLSCTYCHAAPPATARTSLSAVDAEPAARLVAANCARARRPMTVVVHGGGEPGLHRTIVDAALDTAARCAAEAQVETFRYVATNGVLPATTVRWLARRFDVVGLSCDGPEDVQVAQRPTRTGRPTTRAVERTADLVHDAGTGLHVRTTVTPATLGRLTEIVGYLCDRLAPEEIHVEPVYRGGRASSDDGFAPGDAQDFVDGLLTARALASSHGVPLRTAVSRPSEIHGPFCQIFRNVLQLTPSGAVSACFKDTDATADRTRIGRSTAGGEVVLDDRRITALRERLGTRPVRCTDCFNRFHCTLGCPDYCAADDIEDAGNGLDGFRCVLGRELTGRTLSEAADAVWTTAAGRVGPGGDG
jgi:uncharacterized protein